MVEQWNGDGGPGGTMMVEQWNRYGKKVQQ